jgi:hypothetical protein
MDAELSLLPSEHEDGVVVDCGHYLTSIVPITKRKAVKPGIRRFDVASDQIIACMRWSFLTPASTVVDDSGDLLRWLKERHCYVAQDYESELREPSPKVTYELPDSDTIIVGNERLVFLALLCKTMILTERPGSKDQNACLILSSDAWRPPEVYMTSCARRYKPVIITDTSICSIILFSPGERSCYRGCPNV